MTVASVAAAVGAHQHQQQHNMSKGKGPSDSFDSIDSVVYGGPWGSTGYGRGRDESGSASASRSAERFRRLLDGVEESPVREQGPEAGDEEGQELTGNEYRRKLMLYTFVPASSLLLIIFAILLPRLLSPHPLPSRPPISREVLSVLLGAALWTLGHGIRNPLFFLTTIIISSLRKLLIPRRIRLRESDEDAGQWTPSIISIINAVLVAWLQESLRLSIFPIFRVDWYDLTQPTKRLADNAVFYEIWSLALGWALAEICAGILQGYEQLALYEDAERLDENFGHLIPASQTEVDVDFELRPNGQGPSQGGKMIRDSSFPSDTSCSEEAHVLRTQGHSAASGLSRAEEAKRGHELQALESRPADVDVETALTYLADVRAREELEEIYGEPYIEIPIIVPVLQRLDSLLLSLGLTLILGSAYLPPPSSSHSHSLLTSMPPSSIGLLSRKPVNLGVNETFVVLALIHSILSVLYSPPVLPRIGLPAAAYIGCMASLALFFAGIGIWVGVW